MRTPWWPFGRASVSLQAVRRCPRFELLEDRTVPAVPDLDPGPHEPPVEEPPGEVVNLPPAFAEEAVTDVDLAPIMPIGSRTQVAVVSDLIAPLFTDPNDTLESPSGRGIAIVAADSTNGLWQYSIDAGETWDDFPDDLGETNALLLPGGDGSALVRFTANNDLNGAAEFVFRLWDQTEGDVAGQFDITASTTDAFSESTGRVIQSAFAAALPPVFTAGDDVEIDEDAGPIEIENWATDILGNGLGQIAFLVTPLNALSGGTLEFLALPSVSASGGLTFEVAPDSFGTAEFEIVIPSPAGNSQVATLLIRVNSVNDDPSFVVGTDFIVAADAGLVRAPNWATGISPGPENESDQVLTFEIVTDNPNLFLVQPTLDPETGELSYRTDITSHGTAHVVVLLKDDAGGETQRSFTIVTTSVLPVSAQAGRWLRQLYRDILGREADDSELVDWANTLSGGAPRGQIVNAFLSSHEHSLFQVTSFYQTYLNRAPDSGGLEAFAGAIRGGMSLDSVRAFILSSDEYYVVQGGGTNGGFVAALYRGVLGRDTDSASATFDGLLTNGSSRNQIVKFILRSYEADRFLVDGFYRNLLGRPAEADTLDSFTQALQSGGREVDVLAVLFSSDEYFGRWA